MMAQSIQHADGHQEDLKSVESVEEKQARGKIAKGK